MTRLQLALDTNSTTEALHVAEAAIESIDIVEAGTVLILNDGLGSVRELRKRFPDHPLIADIRIGRAGAKFATMAFEAGASIVTVLGDCPFDVVEDAAEIARLYGGTTEIELPPNWEQERLTAWANLGVSTVIAHRTGRYKSVDDDGIRSVLRRLGESDLGGMKVTLAGGFSVGDSQHYSGLPYDTVAVGSAIVKAADPAAAAARLRDELTRK